MSFPNGKQVEAGFTLIEVIFALFLLLLIVTVFLNTFLSNFNINTKEVQRSAATRIVEDTLETYRNSTDYGTLRAPISTTKLVDNVTYTINTTFCPPSAPTDMVCTPTAVYITVEVKNGSQVLQTADTYYARFGVVN